MDLIDVRRKDGLAFEVRVRDRCVMCDMSPADGGRGDGFSPAELLGAAFGACTAMVVQGYLDACGHSQGDVAVSLTTELADAPKRIGALVVDVELPEGVPRDREDAVRRVVEQCVIHGTLTHPPEVDVDIQFS